MIGLLDISANKRAEASAELGHAVGQLVTQSGYANWGDGPWGADNNCYRVAGFDGPAYLRLLAKHKPHKSRCKFVTSPDIVGSARRTLELLKHWYPKLESWPIALVAQDGIEDLDIPWNLIAAIFIGGTDSFKLSRDAIHVGQAAKLMGKHWHVGRVNDAFRWDRFEEAGADTCDGSGLRMTTLQRRNIAERNHNRLFVSANGKAASE